MKTKKDKAINLKKFDTIETLFHGERTVDFLTVCTDKEHNLMIINFMNGSKIFTTQNEIVTFKRGFKPVTHKYFIHDANEIYKTWARQ